MSDEKSAFLFTAAAIKKLKAGPTRKEIRDTGAQSLYLIVQPSGHRSFAVRFRDQRGAPVKITLGAVDLGAEPAEPPTLEQHLGTPLTLSMARTLAAELHRRRALGRNVVTDTKAVRNRRRAVMVEATENSFASVARRFIEEHARPKTRKWRESARFFGLAYPTDGGEPETLPNGLAAQWADRPIGEIDADIVWAVTSEIRRLGVPGLKRRSRGPTEVQERQAMAALSSLFTWAVDQRLVKTNPCRDVRRPKPSPARDRVLDVEEIRKFWTAAEAERIEIAVALKLLLLLGARREEIARMTWGELNADHTVWVLPSARAKNRRELVTQLPPLAQELLATMPRYDGHYVFTTTGRAAINSWSDIKHRLDAVMKPARPWVIHDLRRSFVTGLAELGVRPDVIELLVNHRGGTRASVAGTYNRSELMAERRAALVRWADHLDALTRRKSATVTMLRA
jgi:integrase